MDLLKAILARLESIDVLLLSFLELKYLTSRFNSGPSAKNLPLLSYGEAVSQKLDT